MGHIKVCINICLYFGKNQRKKHKNLEMITWRAGREEVKVAGTESQLVLMYLVLRSSIETIHRLHIILK